MVLLEVIYIYNADYPIWLYKYLFLASDGSDGIGGILHEIGKVLQPETLSD